MNSLEDLNTEEAKQYIGGVAFVSTTMVIGFVGNLHVLLVYAFRMKPSNHRIFILVLGFLDFLTCVIGMPFIIVDLRNPLTFMNPSACKILRFINYFVCTSSGLTLIVIATDRYRKICVPFGRQLSQKMAKLSCLLVLFVSLLLSWPAPVLYGKATVQTSNPYINGSRCYTEDKKNFNKYQGYFNAVLILTIFTSFLVLVVLYSLIWRVTAKHSRQTTPKNIIQQSTNSSSSGKVMNDVTEMSSQTTESIENNAPERPNENYLQQKMFENVSDRNDSEGSSETKSRIRVIDSPKPVQKQKENQSSKDRKRTLMFVMITAVFFLSFIPHFSLKIAAFMKKDFLTELSFTELVLYNTFVWCFFINNMANCFIYGFFDVRFRVEVRKMYSRLFRRA